MCISSRNNISISLSLLQYLTPLFFLCVLNEFGIVWVFASEPLPIPVYLVYISKATLLFQHCLTVLYTTPPHLRLKKCPRYYTLILSLCERDNRKRKQKRSMSHCWHVISWLRITLLQLSCCIVYAIDHVCYVCVVYLNCWMCAGGIFSWLVQNLL